jgi:hypothetical protein
MLLLGLGLTFIVMALFLRTTSGKDEPTCEDLAARAIAASTPGPKSPLDFQPPTDSEMDQLVKCLEEHRQ